jgi:hypothetical protein
MVKQEQAREDKILKGIETIAIQMREQYASLSGEIKGVKSDIDGKFGHLDSRLNYIEAAVIETGLNVKSMAVRLEKTDQKIDTAVTNHESRIRKLEEKVGA